MSAAYKAHDWAVCENCLMPTKSSIRVTKIKGESKKCNVNLAFTFDIDDPKATDIFQGIGLLLRGILTRKEAGEFLSKFEAAKNAA